VAYIPENAKWYVAELINEIVVEDESANVVHKDLVLVRADSPDDAYDKALLLGKASEDAYSNPDGKLVRITFYGLGCLSVICDDLEHGAELIYEERIGVPQEEIEKWIVPKQHLGVFRPRTAVKSPDYSSKEVLEAAERLLRSASQARSASETKP
jgi:hypothetical protein